jgi:putative transcriptional regulator
VLSIAYEWRPNLEGFFIGSCRADKHAIIPHCIHYVESHRTPVESWHLPEAVAEIRYSLGMTQDQFAQATGLTKRQIAEIETGKANPTLETVERIGRLFRFTVGLVPKPEPTLELPAPHLA